MKETWVCPSCGNQVTIHVQLSEPPICHNKDSHTSKQFQMEKETDVKTVH